jgi:hypothetical protein
MAMLDTAAPKAPARSPFDVKASAPDPKTGYRAFELGQFRFERDEYFVTIHWPTKQGPMQHRMSADAFLRALMRDVAWGFFYGLVNFDAMFGSRNLYGRVEFFAGRYNEAYHKAGLSWVEEFDSPSAMATCKAMLRDWCNNGFDPFAAPEETGSTWTGTKHGDNIAAIERSRVATKRMPGLPGDSPLRDDLPVNRAFADVPQDEPVIEAEPGFEGRLHGFNLFKYLSRSDVTWNPSVTSVCKESLYCPTTEEYILPIIHGNDRVEWFIQLSDVIEWEVSDKETGKPRARLVMKPGDVAAMPADIRHQGFATKRSMLLVWENARMDLPQLYESGKLPPYPVEF